MKLQKKLNIVLLLIIIGLIVSLIIVSTTNNKITKKQEPTSLKEKEHQLLEIHNQKEVMLNGIVSSSIVEEVQMKVSGKIDKDNPNLSVGTSLKKNEILIRVDRLEAIYELLAARSEFKQLIQKLNLSIIEKLPEEMNRWELFESKVQRTLPLPDLPKIKSKTEEQLLNKFKVLTQYYKTKTIEKKMDDYFYVTPFAGTIIESKVSSGSSINAGETILKIAKNNTYQVVSNIPLNELERIKTNQTIFFQSANGETLTKGHFLKSGNKLSDSSIVEVYFSMDSQDRNFLHQPVKIVLPKKESKIPASAVKSDSVKIFNKNKVYRLHVETISTHKDSLIVEGLPKHCFIVLNP